MDICPYGLDGIKAISYSGFPANALICLLPDAWTLAMALQSRGLVNWFPKGGF